MYTYIRLQLLVFLMVLSSFAWAQQQKTSYEEIQSALMSIEEDDQTSVEDLITQLDELMAQSQAQGFSDLHYAALATKYAFLGNMQRFDGFPAEINDLIDNPEAEQDQASTLRFIIAYLQRASSKWQLDEARVLQQQLLEISDNDSLNLSLRGRVLESIANSYYDFGEYDRAVKLHQRALEYYQQDNESTEEERASNTGTSYNALANVYDALENTEKAIEYYLKSIPIAEQRDEKFNLSVTYYNLGGAYLNKADFTNANKCAEKAMLNSEALDDHIGVAFANSLFGEIYFAQQHYVKASEYFTKSFDLFSQTDSPVQSFRVVLKLIDALIFLQDYEQANLRLQQAENLRSETMSIADQMFLVSTKFDLQQAQGNYRDAVATQSELVSLLKQDFAHSRTINTERLMAEFEWQQAEQKYQQLQRENHLNELYMQAQDREQWWLRVAAIVGLLVVIAITILLIREKRNRRRYHQLAMTDPLTKAPNRRAIMQIAKSSLEQSVKTKSGFCIAMVDLDHFKQVNDRFGHEVGDQVLILFAQICRNSIRKGDYFGRMGGEEWLLVFPAADKGAVEEVFKRLQQQLADAVVAGIPVDYKLTTSMGGIYQHSSNNLSDLIRAADKNVYQAKQQGRNCLVMG